MQVKGCDGDSVELRDCCKWRQSPFKTWTLAHAHLQHSAWALCRCPYRPCSPTALLRCACSQHATQRTVSPRRCGQSLPPTLRQRSPSGRRSSRALHAGDEAHHSVVIAACRRRARQVSVEHLASRRGCVRVGSSCPPRISMAVNAVYPRHRRCAAKHCRH